MRSGVRRAPPGSVERSSSIALEEERDLALDSLRLLDDELGDGRLEPGEYQLLADEATARAASAIRALAALADDPLGDTADDRSGQGKGGAATAHSVGENGQGRLGGKGATGKGATGNRLPRKRRKVLLVGGLASFAVALIVVVASYATTRLPGRPITGSLKLTATQRLAQQLVQGRVLVAQGRYRSALALFRTVLHDHPGQPEALTYEGWLLVLAGHGSGNRLLMDTGRSDMSKAVATDPTYPDGHLLLGTTLYSYYGDLPDALIQFRLFLADRPSAALVSAAAPTIDAAYAKAGLKSPLAPG
ncbi:MAG: hypothetical protein M0Z87_12590 [Actinomycetota bacterium]|nr:hypothetical protein [Actinomycetota bacterium]